MKANRKFIALSSTIVGILFFLLGIACIVFYIYSVINALDKADKSVIFWYLIFVFIGIALVGLGLYFKSIGHKSTLEDNYTILAKYSLGILSTIIVIIILSRTYSEWSAEKARSERVIQEEVQKSLASEMHQIERIEIDEFDQIGFLFAIHISEGAEGSYRLKTSVDDGQAIFLEEAEEIELDSSRMKIICHVSFEQLF